MIFVRFADFTSQKLNITLKLVFILKVNCSDIRNSGMANGLKTKVTDLRNDWPPICPSIDCDNVDTSAVCLTSNSFMAEVTVEVSFIP